MAPMDLYDSIWGGESLFSSCHVLIGPEGSSRISTNGDVESPDPWNSVDTLNFDFFGNSTVGQAQHQFHF